MGFVVAKTKEEKVKELVRLTEIEKVSDQIFTDFLLHCGRTELTDEDREFKKFLLDTATSNLTIFFQNNLSEKEIDNLLLVYSKPEFVRVLEKHTILFEQAMFEVEIEIAKFLDEKEIRRLAKDADKEEKN